MTFTWIDLYRLKRIVVRDTTILQNSVMSFSRPWYFMVYWKTFGELSPNEPVGASRFCSASTAVMYEGYKPYCAMRSGLSQIRILYVSPSSCTSPTPWIRLISGMTFMSR